MLSQEQQAVAGVVLVVVGRRIATDMASGAVLEARFLATSAASAVLVPFATCNLRGAWDSVGQRSHSDQQQEHGPQKG